MRIAPLVLALELKFHNRKESNFKGNVAKLRAQLFHHDHLQVVMNKVTRPDTRPIPVADGWAGAEMRVFTLSNSITTDQRTDGPTDGQTNGRTDGRTKPLIELRVRN